MTMFHMDAVNGRVTTTRLLDVDTDSITEYVFVVRAYDGGSNDVTATVTITVNDVDEYAPTFATSIQVGWFDYSYVLSEYGVIME